MNIEQLISPAVPTLLPGDTGSQAIALMDENKLDQLPVVSDEHYTALIQENDVLDWSTPGQALESSGFLNYKPAIISSGHPFDAMRLANQMDLTVLPVVDHENKYLGSVTREGLLKYITENSGIDTPGGIIVLDIPPRNYTLYEIARICENEDVIIMNSQVHTNDHGNLDVTLKLNRPP